MKDLREVGEERRRSDEGEELRKEVWIGEEEVCSDPPKLILSMPSSPSIELTLSLRRVREGRCLLVLIDSCALAFCRLVSRRSVSGTASVRSNTSSSASASGVEDIFNLRVAVDNQDKRKL